MFDEDYEEKPIEYERIMKELGGFSYTDQDFPPSKKSLSVKWTKLS